MAVFVALSQIQLQLQVLLQVLSQVLLNLVQSKIHLDVCRLGHSSAVACMLCDSSSAGPAAVAASQAATDSKDTAAPRIHLL